MGKFEEAIERAVAILTEDMRQRSGLGTVSFHGRGGPDEKNRFSQYCLELRAAVPTMERMERIVREGRLKLLKPKVTRKPVGDSIRCNGLWVTPEVQLVAGAELLEVKMKSDLDHEWVGNPNWRIPYVLYRSAVRLGLNFSHDRVTDEIARAVLGDVLEQLGALQRQLAAHWADVGERAPAVEQEYRGRRTAKDRKEFRRKMANALKECKHLVDEPPDFILKVMQLNYGELEVLSKFAKRNPADLPIVEVEDVEMALNDLRVAGVMES